MSKDSIRSLSRNNKRETDTINEQLQKGIKAFFDRRKELCTLDKGIIITDQPEKITSLYDNHNQNWKRFCTVWNKNKSHQIMCDHSAFARYVFEYAEKELKKNWTDELKRIVEELFYCKEYIDEDYSAIYATESCEKGLALPKEATGEAAITLMKRYFDKLYAEKPAEIIPETVYIPPTRKEKFIQFLKDCRKAIMEDEPKEVVQTEEKLPTFFPSGWLYPEPEKQETTVQEKVEMLPVHP